MRAGVIAVFVSAAALITLSAQDARSIDKLAATCAKKGDAKSCAKLYDAIESLTDQALLAKLAVESKDPRARRAAIGEIADQAVLVAVIHGERDADVRRTAIERLLDPATYASVMEQEPDSSIRGTMEARLKAVPVAGNAVPGMAPLIAPEVLDPASAWEAHLKVGWKVFADAREWYNSALSRNEHWFWDTSGAPKALAVTTRGDSVPAPETAPFGVVAIEYMARRYSTVVDFPSLLIGDHFNPAKLDNTAGPGYLDPRPVGRVKWSGDDTAYTLRNGGKDVIIFYTRDAMSRALWFVPAEDMKKQKFSLFLPKLKPIRFSITAADPTGAR